VDIFLTAMALNVFRRSMCSQRRLAQRSIDWAGLAERASSDSAKAEINRLKAAFAEISALSNTYSSPPPPIDFDGYRKQLAASKDVVADFEADYKNITYPQYVAEELASIKDQYSTLVADAEKSVSDSQERIEALTQFVENLESKKVGYETTVEDIYELYPELRAEIEDEIANHEWGKDIA